MNKTVETLKTAQKAREALLWLATREEERALAAIQEVASQLSLEVFAWECVQGFQCLSNPDLRPPNCDGATNVAGALHAVERHNGIPSIFVFKDMDALLGRMGQTPDFVVLTRRIKNLGRVLKRGKNTLVFLTQQPTIPAELESHMKLVELPLPTVEQFTAIVLDWLLANGYRDRFRLDNNGLARLAQAFTGLTADQAYSVLAQSLVRRGLIDDMTVDDVIAEKAQIIKKTGVLELVETEQTLAAVGGLSGLKTWLGKRAEALSPAAAEYGLPAPRGVLLAGIPGTGKSLATKAIARSWRMPLLRMDIGRLFGALVGESEARQRQAIQITESAAPCILHIDELEKGFGGMGGPSGDGGVSQRVYGGLLTWMQEKTKPVFVAATANDVSRLPPELLRKGRFDEVFFIDLPTIEERGEILNVQLRRYNRNPDGLVTNSLLMKLDRYTGAEIEQVIKEALFEAFYDGRRALAPEDLDRAANHVVPIAEQMQERIEALRAWGRRHARPAS